MFQHELWKPQPNCFWIAAEQNWFWRLYIHVCLWILTCKTVLARHKIALTHASEAKKGSLSNEIVMSLQTLQLANSKTWWAHMVKWKSSFRGSPRQPQRWLGLCLLVSLQCGFKHICVNAHLTGVFIRHYSSPDVICCDYTCVFPHTVARKHLGKVNKSHHWQLLPTKTKNKKSHNICVR